MYRDDLILSINEKLKRIKGKKAVLWGAAETSVRLFQYTELGLYPLMHIVDKDSCKTGSDFFGYRVQDPQTVQWESVEAVVVSSYYGEEKICEELISKYGYNGTVITLNEKGQKAPFFQYVPRKLLEVPEGDRDIVSRNQKYRNLHRGERVFVLATGPGINQMDLDRLRNEYCIAASGFYNHKNYQYINPQYHCLVDSAFDTNVNKEDIKKEFQWLGEKTEGMNTGFFFGIHDRETVQSISLYDNRLVNYVSNAAFPNMIIEEIDLVHNVPTAWTASVMAIEIALYMGFKEIYLLGVEHSHLKDMKYVHFYPKEMFCHSLEEAGLTENEEIKEYGTQLKACASLWKQYEQLKMAAEDMYGAKIYNASINTCLDVFDIVDYDSLFFV